MINWAPLIVKKITAYVFAGASLVYFITLINFSNFTTWFYHTMSKSVYDTLVSEFKKDNKLFTIGGHREREMNYAFANYRGNSVLNPMNDNMEMQMNCDYYYAMKREKPYYSSFYDEIAYDEAWDMVLLKRKEKIGHNLIYSNYNGMRLSGNGEFYDIKRLPDTTFKSHNPLEVEVELRFEDVPKPLNAFFVMSLQNAKGETVCYKRTPLNWLADDLNGQVKYLKLTTGNLPDTVKSFAIHIWNIDKKEIKISVNNLKLYQLTGKGVDFKVPAGYYPLIEKITKKPLM